MSRDEGIWSGCWMPRGGGQQFYFLFFHHFTFDQIGMALLLILAVVIIFPSCVAFAPVQRLGMSPSVLHSKSLWDDGANDVASSTINIALITCSSLMKASAAANNSNNGNNYHERMKILLNDHPFCKMTGIKLSIADVSVISTAVTWTEEEVTCLQQADVACFDTTQAVRTYLDILDKQIHDYTLVPDASILDEGRRKLPNKPCLGERSSNDASIIPATTSSASTSMTPSLMMAACPNFNTAKVCLDSGRWTSNHIYYPKDANMQKQGVELKVLPIDNNNNDVHSIDDANMIENVNFEIWADSIVQAAGDVMERKFWGGGW